MSESARLITFLDANVLFPALLRNLLMPLALRGLYQARRIVSTMDRGAAAQPAQPDLCTASANAQAD